MGNSQPNARLALGKVGSQIIHCAFAEGIGDTVVIGRTNFATAERRGNVDNSRVRGLFEERQKGFGREAQTGLVVSLSLNYREREWTDHIAVKDFVVFLSRTCVLHTSDSSTFTWVSTKHRSVLTHCDLLVDQAIQALAI